jgi:uncharacterized protein YkwD
VLRARFMTVCLAVVAMAFVSISCTKNVTVAMKDGNMSLAAVPEAAAPPAAVPNAARSGSPPATARASTAAPAPASAARPVPTAAAQKTGPTPPPQAARPVSTPLPTVAVAAGSRQQELTNQARAAAGLAPLQWNSCLAGVAQLHATEMAQAGHIYHGDGVQRDLRCGLGSNRSGENVGMTSPGIDDNRIFAGFMGSAGHKANILGPYRYIGTAWVTGAGGTGYVSVEFAS